MCRVQKIGIERKFATFSEHWRPKTIAEMNGQEVKLVKVKGEFPWHVHADEDEMFLVWRGNFRVEFLDHSVGLEAGEMIVIPRGIEHRTVSDEEAEVLIFEPAATRNTGNVVDDEFTAPLSANI